MKEKRCVWMVFVLLCLMGPGRAQVITIENGVSVAKLKKGYDGQNLYPYQMSLGMEYMDRGRYNLSSQIGFPSLPRRFRIEMRGRYKESDRPSANRAACSLFAQLHQDLRPVVYRLQRKRFGPRPDIYRRRVAGIHPSARQTHVVFGPAAASSVNEAVGRTSLLAEEHRHEFRQVKAPVAPDMAAFAFAVDVRIPLFIQ